MKITVDCNQCQDDDQHLTLDGKWFELRGISYLFGMIVRVRVVFRPITTTFMF